MILHKNLHRNSRLTLMVRLNYYFETISKRVVIIAYVKMGPFDSVGKKL